MNTYMLSPWAILSHESGTWTGGYDVIHAEYTQRLKRMTPMHMTVDAHQVAPFILWPGSVMDMHDWHDWHTCVIKAVTCQAKGRLPAATE